MSTATIARTVCQHCQTEITDGWEQITDQACFECYIEPLADAEAADEAQRLMEQGLLPERLIGC